jgi:hypothetical protein
MSQKIIDALKKLDPANEDHWTTEGLPRLEVLKDILGEVVSRVDVTNAARGFSRATTDILNQPAPAVQPVATVTEGANVQLEVVVNEPVSEQQNEEEPYATYLQRKHDALEAQVMEAGVAATEAASAFQSLQRQLNNVAVELANELNVNSSAVLAETVAAYQKSQQDQLVAQSQKADLLARAMQMIADGVVQ